MLKRLIKQLKAAAKRLLKQREENYVHYLSGQEQLPAPLSKEEEEAAFRLMETDFDKARDTLIVHNLRLVVYIAKKFENTGIWLEDLVSIGTVGLIKAVSTFSKEKNIKLATYASRCIENEILMFLRKYSQYRYDVSIDEPLNVDWDGNELLLSDVLGTENDCVNSHIEEEVEKQLLHDAVNRLGERERKIMEMRSTTLIPVSRTSFDASCSSKVGAGR